MMNRYIMSTSIGFRLLIALNLLSIGDAYFGQSHVSLEDLNFIHLTEDGYDDKNPEGRLFFSNNTDLAAFAALSLFPLLFLAAACGGALLQWMMSGGLHDKGGCDDHYYYDSGYGGGGYSSGHGGGYRRSSDDEEGYDYDYKRSYQKRSTNSDSDISAMASKLHMLDEFFRKFEMDDLGCQMLLSCESAQLETMEHPIYGDLTSKIHKFLSSAKSSRQSKSGTRVEKLLQAHREGRKHGSSCKKLYGGLCHNLMEKLDRAEEEDKARINEKLKEDEEKPTTQQDKDSLSFWEKKSKMAKLDMNKKMMMKKKKYRMKY